MSSNSNSETPVEQTSVEQAREVANQSLFRKITKEFTHQRLITEANEALMDFEVTFCMKIQGRLFKILTNNTSVREAFEAYCEEFGLQLGPLNPQSNGYICFTILSPKD